MQYSPEVLQASGLLLCVEWQVGRGYEPGSCHRDGTARTTVDHLPLNGVASDRSVAWIAQRRTRSEPCGSTSCLTEFVHPASEFDKEGGHNLSGVGGACRVVGMSRVHECASAMDTLGASK